MHENGSLRDLLAWNGRGWCRMEQVSNALSPKNKPVICATSVTSVKNFGPCEVLGRLWFNEVVGKGAFFNEADKYALRDVIKGMIDRRKAQALQQGDLIWYRALAALTTSILAGTDYVAEDANSTLTEWLAKLRFTSVHDGRDTGHTPLRYAVIEGRVDLVKMILEDPTVDIQAPLKSKAQCLMFNMLPGLTILHQACMSQHGEACGEIIKLLLARGANPRTQTADQQKWQPLHMAVTSDCRPGIAALMAHDASLHTETITAGLRVFERCAVAGLPGTMRFLIEQYPDHILPYMTRLNPYAGISMCMAAVFEENAAEMLSILIENGADPNLDDGSWLPAPVKKAPPMKLLLKFMLPKLLRNKRVLS